MEWLSGLLDIIFQTLNATMQSAVGMLSQSPETFNGILYQFSKNLGTIFQSVGVSLVVLFFFLGLADPSHSLGEIKRPEAILAEFVRLVVCNLIVVNSSFILEKITAIGTNLITVGWNAANNTSGGVPSLAADNTVKEAMQDIDFGILSIGADTIFLLLLNFILVIAMGIAILYIAIIAYTRFFKIYMYIAIAPIPLSTFACRSTSDVGKQFIKSFCGVLLQGLILVIAFMLFTLFFNNVSLDESQGAVSLIWNYSISVLGQLFVLIAIIKGSDQLVYKMLGV